MRHCWEFFIYLISYYYETMNRVLIKMPFDDNAAFAVEIKREVLYILLIKLKLFCNFNSDYNCL